MVYNKVLTDGVRLPGAEELTIADLTPQNVLQHTDISSMELSAQQLDLLQLQTEALAWLRMIFISLDFRSLRRTANTIASLTTPDPDILVPSLIFLLQFMNIEV